ncbi:hypothetical protein GCM10025865_27010 [Paraoerskovia sediminicola]|uniref:NADP-dependent 3-hydroxy acid dehydrogenase YdfG n=1 Tax=Paraoerskovia sediminicola TaxID=1138587 RepID=A0ABN6XEN7_9CELL|nr:hypothetical protein GCM10025865_27010 [Paraoerskovia sediminicola]
MPVPDDDSAGGTGPLTAVVVVGATGFVGSRLVRHLGDAGFGVVVCGRTRLERFADRAAYPEVIAALDAGAVTGEASPHAVAVALDDLARTHRLVGVVASIGGWSIADRLEEVPADTWAGFLDSHLTSHLRAVQRLAPRLPDGAAYVVLNGAASHTPMAGSGPVSVTGAALHMLVEVLRLESAPGGVRYREVVVEHAVAGDERNVDPDREVSARAVGEAVVAALAPGSEAVVRVGATPA